MEKIQATEQTKWARQNFWDKLKTREERENFLKTADNEFIEKLIDAAGSVQAKIYLSQFKKA